MARCLFCSETGGTLLWTSQLCRVVLADEPDQPGLCRVVLTGHVAEMTDLLHADAAEVMRIVFATERAVRDALRPDKVNLASLGNLIPHLHWHVIPRWEDDRHFPRPIWAEPLRPATVRPVPADLADYLTRDLAAALGDG